jgi:hypothetical protein
VILTIPPDRSSTIREVRATEREDGNFSDVIVSFTRGGSERHPFVVGDDLRDVLEAKSIGTTYWRVFRKKYKMPERVEDPPVCGAWMPDDVRVVSGTCQSAVPCESHQEGK